MGGETGGRGVGVGDGLSQTHTQSSTRTTPGENATEQFGPQTLYKIIIKKKKILSVKLFLLLDQS